MHLSQRLFIEALKASLENRMVQWEFRVEESTWRDIFELATAQKVLPLIFEAVYACPAVHSTEFSFYNLVKRRCIENMIIQTKKTAEFLQVYQTLQENHVTPLVVKGILCRSLYPNPDLRASADEDLLVKDSEFLQSMKLLESCGLHRVEPERDTKTADELGFLSEKGAVYIELHKSLFSTSSELWSEMNGMFANIWEKNVTVNVQGVDICSMEPTMHLLYLICHAFKHFLHSGFGIRQVCDIVLFANAYGHEIDWSKLLKKCKEIKADKFTVAIFKIGQKYLAFDEKKACYPLEWKEIHVEELPLLRELLDSGIYGGSTMSRKHSSNMTLEAVEAQNKGKKSRSGLVATVFPKAKKLEGQYTYLKKQPYLLPIAWGERLLKYYKETSKIENDHALESVKIGNQRIELLKLYGIIEK